jgi:putative membrane protein
MDSAHLAPLSGSTAITSWRFDPVGIIVAVVLAGAYLTAIRRAPGWPLRRSLTFLVGGVGSLVLTTCSFLGVYAPALRWIAVIQACLLLLVCPMLLGLGAPIALLQRVRGPATRSSGFGRGLWALLRGPGVGPLVIILVTSALVFTPWLSWSVGRTDAHAVTVPALLAAGLMLALPVTDEGARTSSLAYAAMLGLGLFEFLLDAVPGMVLRLNSHVIVGSHWVALHRSWGPTPLADQRLAGDWLWFFAEAGDLPFLLILIVAWIRSDAHEAARQDAELDLLEDDDGMIQPWWETERRN